MSGNSSQQIGTRIRRVREERDMSLTDLARASGVSRGYLHLLEKGEYSPSQEKLSAIAQALGVLVSELIGEIESYEALDIPESLREFAEENGLLSADVAMLSKINFRGRRPETAIEWGILYSVIKGTLDKD